jgi:hypothetical protein
MMFRRWPVSLTAGVTMTHTHAVSAEQTIASYQARSRDATSRGAEAYARLLALTEHHDSGQIVRVARFIASTYNGQVFSFDLFDLRTLDVAISDDMLLCLDALRWGVADLYKLVPDGDARVRSLIDRWQLRSPI